jgi:hypothetical protein
VTRKEILKLASNLPKLLVGLIAMKVYCLVYILLEDTKTVGNNRKGLSELNLLGSLRTKKGLPYLLCKCSIVFSSKNRVIPHRMPGELRL